MDYHIEFLLKILVCFLLSACIGVERQFRGRKAGLRTVILVSLGSFLFILFTNIVLRSLNRRINLLSGKGTYNVYHFSITCDKKDLDKLQELTKEVIKDNEGRIDSTEITTLDNNDKKLSIYILDNALNDKLTKNLMNELSSKKEVLSISLNKESKKSIYEDEEL